MTMIRFFAACFFVGVATAAHDSNPPHVRDGGRAEEQAIDGGGKSILMATRDQIGEKQNLPMAEDLKPKLNENLQAAEDDFDQEDDSFSATSVQRRTQSTGDDKAQVFDFQIEIFNSCNETGVEMELNRLLFLAGLGADGKADSVPSGICLNPNRAKKIASGGRPFGGYQWVGTTGCTNCGFIDATGAMGTASHIIYDTVQTALLTAIFPKYCTGIPILEIAVDEIASFEIDPLFCKGELFQTMDFDLAPPVVNLPTGCGSCVTLNFDSKADATDFAMGDFVSQNEYEGGDDANVGVSIYASHGNFTERIRTEARIFDTSNPGTAATNGYPQLGSPNLDCEGGGPGTGYAGRYDNCKSIGNAIIIQDPTKTYPFPNEDGGTITFAFNEPVTLLDVGILNVPRSPQTMKFKTKGRGKNTIKKHAFVGFGENSAQRVLTNQSNVTKMKMRLTGPGSITELTYCPICKSDS